MKTNDQEGFEQKRSREIYPRGLMFPFLKHKAPGTSLLKHNFFKINYFKTFLFENPKTRKK